MTEKTNAYIGKRFSRLFVIDGCAKFGRSDYYNCVCDCGNKVVVKRHKLKTRHTQSCGCLQKERAKEANTVHGMSKNTPEYGIWKAMKRRCLSEDDEAYHNYGGRGIKINQLWVDSFEDFFKYVGNRPSIRHSIDRIENNGNYDVGNVRWATKKEQAQNRSTSVWIEYNHMKMVQKDWADYLGVSPQRIDYLLNHKGMVFSDIYNLLKNKNDRRRINVR